MLKTCIKCGIERPIAEYNFKNKAKGRRNARCKLCTRREISDAYYNNRQHYLEYRTKRNFEIRQEISSYLFDYLTQHPCVDCGISDPIVLEFDHVTGKKLMAISHMVRRRYTLKAIIEEIKKCQVRCANCHAKKTARDFNHFAFTRQKIQEASLQKRSKLI